VEGKGRERKGKDSDATHLATASPPGPLDLKKELFNRGTAFLEANGLPADKARKMLGMWRKSYGDLAIINALAAAEGAAVSDPIPYITQSLKEAPRGKSDSTLSTVSSLMRLAQEDPGDDVF
jgi:hypothetical protein